MRTFTTDGPCDVEAHYVLPSAPRLAEARSLIDRGAYFILHAPDRTGKTTALSALAAELTAQGSHAALLCSAKVAGSAHGDVVSAQNALLCAITIAAEQHLPPALRPPPFSPSGELTRIWESLSHWAQVCPLPIVLFFDDLDSLAAVTLENLLQQLETGFLRRPKLFPWAVGLVSRLDLRRNRLSEDDDSADVHATGPFESFWSSRLLSPFTVEEIRALYAQHFGTLDQAFVPELPDLVHDLTAGHPFFVQALGRELAAMAVSTKRLTNADLAVAHRNLVARQISPVDDLTVRLAEPRVRRVLESVFSGTAAIASVAESDIQFVRDLGLLAHDEPVRIADAFHKALVPRLLTKPALRMNMVDVAACFDEQGKLVLQSALSAFAAFYTTHGTDLVAAMPYPKIAEELVFLGFLLQLAEGRGWVDVEYGPARGRIDITMTISLPKSSEESNVDQREVFVMVARRKGESGSKKHGMQWLEGALQQAPHTSGTLVIVDKRGKRSSEKNFKWRESVTEAGKTVRLLRI